MRDDAKEARRDAQAWAQPFRREVLGIWPDNIPAQPKNSPLWGVADDGDPGPDRPVAPVVVGYDRTPVRCRCGGWMRAGVAHFCIGRA
jgi:hypothetical protein